MRLPCCCSAPVSAWVAAIILANEIPDAPSDAATGKRTLAVRLAGAHAAAPRLHAGRGLRRAAPAWRPMASSPPGAWRFPLGLLAVGLHASRLLGGSREQLAQGIRRTLGVHAAGCLWLLAVIAVGESGNY